jgi:adenylate cyclase
VPWGAHWWEIDEFHGANAGLIVAEIELDAEDEVFETPPWLGAEVSDDRRYYNVCLIDRPYSKW